MHHQVKSDRIETMMELGKLIAILVSIYFEYLQYCICHLGGLQSSKVSNNEVTNPVCATIQEPSYLNHCVEVVYISN